MSVTKLRKTFIILSLGLLFIGQTFAIGEDQEKESSQTMMEQMPMSPQMMKRMQIMMDTPIFLDSPCAIYGQKNRLNLTDEQKSRLIEIENEARKKALAVLTSEQKTTLYFSEKQLKLKDCCTARHPTAKPWTELTWFGFVLKMRACMFPEISKRPNAL